LSKPAEKPLHRRRKQLRLVVERKVPGIGDDLELRVGQRLGVTAAGRFGLQILRAAQHERGRRRLPQRGAPVVPAAHAEVHRLHHPTAAGLRIVTGGWPLEAVGPRRRSVRREQLRVQRQRSASLFAKTPPKSK
jgi:hypothetical protein